VPERPAVKTKTRSPGSARGFAASGPPQSLLYLRPTGILSGAAAAAAHAAKLALPLAGGPLAFSACEVLRRTPEGVTRAFAPLAEIERSTRGSDEDAEALAASLEGIAAPRTPFAGLSLERPRLMGVVNATPDSFSDGGDHATPAAAIAHGKALIAAGAEIVDVGGESTRPGAEAIGADAELGRVGPVLAGLAGGSALLSIDTRHAPVMEAALDAGAAIVNDVTALAGDPASLDLVARRGAAVVLMHMQGEPKSMQRAPHYDDVALEVYDFLQARIAVCLAAGIPRGRIAIDPGLGFGKSFAHNHQILERLALFHGLGCALLVGASRKSFTAGSRANVSEKARLGGSLAAALAALGQGAQLLRVHDVAETRQAIEIWRGAHGLPSGRS
jgi:dihydropteroate synthase